MSEVSSFVAVAIAATHAALCVFLVVGGPIGLRRHTVAVAHLVCLVPTALVNVLRLDCPLTVAENWARRHAGMPAYDGGFIEHHLVRPSAIVGVLVIASTAASLLWRLHRLSKPPVHATGLVQR